MKIIGEKIENKEYKERKTACALIFNDAGEIAVAYVGEFNIYNLIGGKIEEGENPEEALKREAKEEIGYTLKNIKFLDNIHCYCYIDIFNKYELAKINVFSANIDKKISDKVEEGYELLWRKPEKIKDKLYFEYHRYIVENFI